MVSELLLRADETSEETEREVRRFSRAGQVKKCCTDRSSSWQWIHGGGGEEI